MFKLQPVKLKNILIGVLIGMGILLVAFALWYYFAAYSYIRDAKQMEERIKEVESGL